MRTLAAPRFTLLCVAVLAFAASCGDDSATATSDASTSVTPTSATVETSAPGTSTVVEDADDHSNGDHGIDAEPDQNEPRGAVDVEPATAPTVDIDAELIESGEVVVTVKTTNFEFVSEGGSPRGAEPHWGHAHLEVNGVLGAMFYSDTYTLALAPGENEVSVSLTDGSHRLLSVDGAPIRVTKMVHVPDAPDVEFHTHDD